MENDDVLDGHFGKMFEALYWDLVHAFPHPFEWMGLLHRPKWWQFRARKAHYKVAGIFVSHGLMLTDHSASAFIRTPGQRVNEDCGGAIIRQLRTAFQGQYGVPYE